MLHPQTVPILMYHSIGSECSQGFRRWTVSPADFDRHMKFLADHRYEPLTVSAFTDAVETGKPLPDRTVLITFDDGLQDFYTDAFPTLQHYGFCATLYVVTGRVEETSRWLAPLGEGGRPMMSWREVALVCRQGIEIGAHTHTHPQLDILTHKHAREEIVRSKAELENRLGRPVRTFAYPHGFASAATRRIVEEAGFTSACRVRHALSTTTENRFALSRIIVSNDTTTEQLGLWLDGAGLRVAPSVNRLGARVARLVRKAASQWRHDDLRAA